jgi:hypothetical protein
MSLSNVATRPLRNLLMRTSTRTVEETLAPASRRAARRLLDEGGPAAQDILGLGIGGAAVSQAVRATRKKAAVIPIEQRVVANHVAGHKRERLIERFLKAVFPSKERYRVLREQYLRTRKGEIAIDKRTKQSRRIDFVVLQGDEVVRSIEVTGSRVNKAAQLRKEADIRRAGGRYLFDPISQAVIRIPAAIKTTVFRIA